MEKESTGWRERIYDGYVLKENKQMNSCFFFHEDAKHVHSERVVDTSSKLPFVPPLCPERLL